MFPVTLPPLRERTGRHSALVEHFARAGVRAEWVEAGRRSPTDAIAALQEYSWPGNVRELRNAVERLLLLATSETVDAATVELALPRANPLVELAAGEEHGGLYDRIAVFERETILAELQRQNHHITNTARALGLERSHLYKKCEQLGVDLRAARGAAQRDG